MKLLNSLLLVFCLATLACSPRDTDPITKEDREFIENSKAQAKLKKNGGSAARPLNSRPYLSKFPEFEFTNYILEKEANVLSLIPLAVKLVSENKVSSRLNCYSIDLLEQTETTRLYSIVTEMCSLNYNLPTLDSKGKPAKLGTLDLSGNMVMKLGLVDGKVQKVEVKSESSEPLLSPKVIIRKDSFKGGQAATLVDHIDLSATIKEDGTLLIENLYVATDIVIATDEKTEKGKMVLWTTNSPLAAIKTLSAGEMNPKKFEYEVTNTLKTRFVYDMEIVGGAHSNVSLNLDLRAKPVKQSVGKTCVINEGLIPMEIAVGSKIIRGELLISDARVSSVPKANSTAKPASLALLPCESKMQNSVDLLFLVKPATNTAK